MMIDSRRHHKPIVVIGMFAYQVDATRRNKNSWNAPKLFLKDGSEVGRSFQEMNYSIYSF